MIGNISNNVFYFNDVGLAADDVGPDAPVVIRNNVAVANVWGFTGQREDADYNVAWGNTADYWPEETFGPNDGSSDPLFEDEAAGDFSLRSGSPLIDAGDPDAAYDDPDGSRNDIGAFGGPHGEWTPP